MPADDFDLLILGGGMGGYPAAIRASQLGLKVALVEADKLGGTCLHVGCIPTKVLLESSELYHRISARGPEFGVDADKVRFDYVRIAARRDSVVSQLHKGVQFLMKKNKIEVVAGSGRLRDRNTLEIGAKQLRAKNLIVATGSTVRSLPGLEFDGELIISSDNATLSTKVPESICIIGAGAVGVEFATLYSQLGVKVTLLEGLDRLVPLEDEEISNEMLSAFKKGGIDCRVGVKVKGAKKARGGVAVDTEQGELWAHQLLVAVGRSPRSKDIGLEKVGIETHPNGFIKVDEWMRTSAEGIHAIGDVVAGFLLAPPAAPCAGPTTCRTGWPRYRPARCSKSPSSRASSTSCASSSVSSPTPAIRTASWPCSSSLPISPRTRRRTRWRASSTCPSPTTYTSWKKDCKKSIRAEAPLCATLSACPSIISRTKARRTRRWFWWLPTATTQQVSKHLRSWSKRPGKAKS